MRKLKKLIFFILILVALIYFLPSLLLPLVKDKIPEYLEDYFKTEINLKDIKINLFARNIVLEDFSIENTKQFGHGNLLETKEAIIQPKILSFIIRKPVIGITLNNPTLNLYLLSKGETNWDFFWGKEGPNNNSLILNRLLIKNGTFRYIEERSPNKLAFAQLQGLFIYLERFPIPLGHVKNIPLHTKIKGRGYLPTEPKGVLYFNVKANIEEERPSFSGDISMQNISLIYFNNFYPEDSQIKVLQGNFSLASQIKCIEDQLYARPSVIVKDLRLKLLAQYDNGKVFNLPVVLVVDFFDLYKEELKFTFDVAGTLTDPDFLLGDVIAQKVTQVIGDSIVRALINRPKLLFKLGKKAIGPIQEFFELLKGD